MTRGVLALLGSGETAPGMTKVHRRLLERYSSPVVVSLDTAYAFQENLPQMSAKLEGYFRVSLQVNLATVSFPSYANSDEIERRLVTHQVSGADYIFAGPGSPSYALKQWQPLGLASTLRNALTKGSSLCFSSAAALTVGSHTAPVYEIYKVGEELRWLEGLDLLGALGIRAAVIPHYDNAEGGNHDTSRCYLGERRLSTMIDLLPDDTSILGIDEHTAILLDLESDTGEVVGRGRAYWRQRDEVREIAPGEIVALSELRSSPLAPLTRETPTNEEPPTTMSALELARLTSDPARRDDALAQLVVLAESGGMGYIEPTELVEGVLEARRNARAAKQFELADQLRNALVAGGIEVNDGDERSTWGLRK